MRRNTIKNCPNCKIGSNLQPCKNKITPARRHPSDLRIPKQTLLIVIKIIWDVLSDLLFKRKYIFANEAGADIKPRRNSISPQIDAQLSEALTIFINRGNIEILIKF